METSKQIPKLVAIIGAGVAGLGAAWRLAKNPSVKVTIFEKSQTISGRAATRRKPDYFYDNGANYFTTDNKETLALLQTHFPHDKLITIPKPIWTFNEDGKIKPGDPEHNKKPKFNYKQGIKTFGKLIWAECEEKVELQYNKRLDKIVRITQGDDSKLKLISTENEDLGIYDAVLLTPPAPQIADILKLSELGDGAEVLQEKFRECKYKSIISVALVFRGRLNKEYFALINSDRKHCISWLSFENEKEGHVPQDETMMIIQMADNWSTSNYGLKDEEILSKVLNEVQKLFTDGLEEVYKWGDVKKWKFALPEKPMDEKVFDIGMGHNVFFAGDFVRGKGRVLDAFEEGLKTADLINQKLFFSPSAKI